MRKSQKHPENLIIWITKAVAMFVYEKYDDKVFINVNLCLLESVVAKSSYSLGHT